MAGGRLCEICREGGPPGEPLRWDHHGPSVIRPGTERRDLEDRGEDFSACSALYKDFVEEPLIFSDQPAVLSYMLGTEVKSKFGGKVTADEIGLPVSSNGLVLPCGASGRWESV